MSQAPAHRAQTTSGGSPVRQCAGAVTPSPAAGDAAFAVSVVTIGPKVSWLSAVGKLVDEIAAAQLADVLQRQRALGCRFARLDLSHVSMLDRASFDVIVEAHHQFLAVDGMLVLTGVAPRIARLLELTGLDRTLFAIPRATDPAPGRAGLGPGRDGARNVHVRRSAPAVQVSTAANGPAMVERRLIDRAVGVVMGRTHCGVAEATKRLLLLSQATNRTLREVAQSVLDESTRTRRNASYAHLTRDDVDRSTHRAETDRSTAAIDVKERREQKKAIVTAPAELNPRHRSTPSTANPTQHRGSEGSC